MNYNPPPSETIFPLQAITQRLKEVLVEFEAKRFWVRAQFVPDGGTRRNGHCYGSLVEHDETGRPIAKMRAVIWRSYRERIEQKLYDAGCEQRLAEQQEICALSAIRFHPVYGLSLDVYDVDPTLGVSILEKNRRDVLERLREANLLDLNKGLAIPAASLRIGLITAAGSAAYEDFTKTLLMSGFAFQVFVVHATMQGETTPAQVTKAIQLLECRGVDVICLVRGGGSPVDLASFDRDNIGQTIAECRKPVWVGIGHEIDVTVPDFVAHTSHKTPTAVAIGLVERLQELESRLRSAAERLEDDFQRTLLLADRDLDRNKNGLRQGIRKHLELYETRFRGLGDRIRRSVKGRLTGEQSQLENNAVRLQERIGRVLASKSQWLGQSLLALSRGAVTRVAAANKDIDHSVKRLRQVPRLVDQRLASLDERQRYLEAVSPERILARGYSLTRDDQGNILRDASQTEPGQTIHTQLSHGTLTSTVTKQTQDRTNGKTEEQRTHVRAKRETPGGDSGAVGPLGNSHG